jgi:hypothetical protein
VSDTFTSAPVRPPSFGGKRRVDAKYAIEWVKKRLREIHRQALTAHQPSPLTESAAHLYLLLGTYVPNGRWETEDIDRRDLVAVMHCEPATLTRARKILERAIGDVRLVAGGRGIKTVRFAFVRMGGPLLVDALAGATKVELKDRPDIDLNDRALPALGSLRSTSASDPLVPRSEEEDPSSSSVNDMVDDYACWWSEAYPEYHDGRRSAFKKRWHRPIRQLLDNGYSLELIGAMTIVVWTAVADGTPNRTWIAESDRSVFVLTHKPEFLVAEVDRLGLLRDREASRPWSMVDCPHVVTCPHGTACQVALANPDKYPVRRLEATGT